MAFVQQVGPNHAVVHMASPTKSKIKVEVHMSHEEAERIVGVEGPPVGGGEDPRNDPFEIRLARAIQTNLMLP